MGEALRKQQPPSTLEGQTKRLPRDRFGGTRLRVGEPTGFFHLERLGNRRLLVTPEGNAYWLTSVYHALEAFLEPSVIPSKYGGDANLWATHRNERLLSWGFNTLGEYTSTRGLPVGTWGSTTGNSIQLPFILIMGAAVDSMSNPISLGLPEAVKDILAGVPTSAYNSYRGPLVDVYDPKFAQAYAAEVSYWSQAITGGFANCPWVVGITTDDADNLFGFKSGAGAPVNAYPHIGYLAATTQFNYSGSLGAWQDSKLYTKYAWITYLKGKYANIQALNSAWSTGGFYTSFDDMGGYGSGTGVIDEDGRHTAWMGTMVYPFTNTGANSGVQSDLDTFLYQFVKTYTQTATTAIRAVDHNHLIFGPASINNYGAMARPQVIQGLADGGIDVLQVNYDPIFGPNAGSMGGNNATYDLVGKPVFVWYSVTANADSDMSAQPPVYGAPNFPTQGLRGSHYQNVDLPAFLNAQGSNGDYYVLGFDWWELVDNPGEGMNWGILTRLDNAYDGNEAVIATGVDPWGFPTGGEAANYGNFLGSVKAANATILNAIAVGR